MRDKRFVLSIICFLITIMLVLSIARRGEPIVVKTNLERLPMVIEGYEAAGEGSLSDAVYEELNADKHVIRHYQKPNGEAIYLYIGYYGTAKGGRSRHNPYGCLPGAGWGILKDGKEKLRPLNYPSPVDVNYILAKKGKSYVTVLHWYQSGGDKVLAGGIQQNIQRFLGRIFHNRADGARVEISVFTSEGEVTEAKLVSKSFAENLIVLLPRYWPIEN